jgi:FtsH-binding integral membrane protein
MAYPERNASARYGSVSHDRAAEIDQGLRAYMLKVYNYMAIGLAVTGLVAYFAANAAVASFGPPLALTAFGDAILNSPLRFVIMLAPLGAVLFLSFRIDRMSVAAAQGLFWAFAAVMGLSLSSIFLVYTGQSITQVFFVTAASFGALSLFGYTTKRDLTGMGSFLIMGLFGVIIASIVNIFLQSSALGFAVSVIGVLVFAGLTAYDTQRIKEMYSANDDHATAGRKAIMGALQLYLDFINMFVMLLQLFGERR